MWQARAVCATLPTRDSDALLFPKDGDYTAGKALCAGCPVREQCLDYAIKNRISDGMFGGLTPEERKPLTPAQPDHGTYNRWSAGCRCDDCVDAKRTYTRRQMRRWRAGTPTQGDAA